MSVTNAINFNKTSSVIMNNIPAFGSNFTVDLWLKLNSLSQTDYTALFIRGNAATANGVHIYGNKLGVRKSESGSLGTELEPISNLNINTWYRLTFTYNGAVFNYYRDGVLIKTITMSGEFSNSIDYLNIGDWKENYNAFLDGAVHDFKIYNECFTDEDLSDLIENMKYSIIFPEKLITRVKLDGTDSNIYKLIGTYRMDTFDKYGNSKSFIYNDGEYKKIVISDSTGQARSWETVAITTPTVSQFINDGMDSLSPLLDRKVTTLEPIDMTIKNGVLQTGEKGKVFSKTIDLKKYMDLRKVKVEVMK